MPKLSPTFGSASSEQIRPASAVIYPFEISLTERRADLQMGMSIDAAKKCLVTSQRNGGYSSLGQSHEGNS